MGIQYKRTKRTMKFTRILPPSLDAAALLLATGFPTALRAAAPPPHTFAIGTNDFLLDGQRLQIRCGEVHAARVPREYWQNRLHMAKAMGLNTVCAYLFWNMHEPLPGQFNWSGQADVAEFCRLAQKEGLWVVLRPGPYACAEWEMGGLPWWLLKNDAVKLRTRDPLYLKPAKVYLKEVGRVLGPLQITHGGPIIMVQVENEYGSFGRDTNYMGDLRQTMLDAGFDVPLFACNPTGDLTHGYRSDLFPVVNFGSDPRGAISPPCAKSGPLARSCAANFIPVGSTPGARRTISATRPNTSPIWNTCSKPAVRSASTWPTAARPSASGVVPIIPSNPTLPLTITTPPSVKPAGRRQNSSKPATSSAKYLLPGEKLPDTASHQSGHHNRANYRKPDARKFFVTCLRLNPTSIRAQWRTMTKASAPFYIAPVIIPAGPAATLEAAAVHDYGYIYLRRLSRGANFMDRRSRNFKVRLPERKKPATLDVYVEAVGRVNFGIEIHDHKGLVGDVTLGSGDEARTLTNWQIFNLPLDENMLSHLQYDGWFHEVVGGDSWCRWVPPFGAPRSRSPILAILFLTCAPGARASSG